MGKPGILLTELSDGWEIGSIAEVVPVVPITGHEPEEIANATIAFAKQHALDHGQVVIAVATESVLFARIPANDAVDIKSNQALRYALEAVLPVDAESIVADSIRQDGQNTTTGVAAVAMEKAHINAIVDALEGSLCKVQFIVPLSMLVFEQTIVDKTLQVPSVSVWMLDQENGTPNVEILSIDLAGSIRSWQVTELETETIDRHLSQLDSDTLKVVLFGSGEELTKLASVVRCEAQSIEIDRADLARKRALSILSGREDPWIDLRRDELASHDRWRRDRSSISWLAVAIGLFLATLCGTLFLRAQTYRRLADGYAQKQLDLFRGAFPEQRVPAAIVGRLKSEHTKAMGVRKTDPTTSAPKSALVVLHRIIESLKNDFPFEVEEIRIENGRFAIEIELLSQQDAGMIALSLASKGFNVEPPATTLVHGDRVLASFNASLDGAVR